MELNCGDGTIMASSTFSAIGGTQLIDQQESSILMALAAQGLLSNEAQIPTEAGLVGHLETARPVAAGSLQEDANNLKRADPDAIMTEA